MQQHTQKQLLEKFNNAWTAAGFPHKGQTVLAAVSGGRDSMVLATLLLARGQKFAIAHVNFSLRGTASDDDALFVKEWAAKHNVPFHEAVFDTKKIMAEHGGGVQEIARKLRYDFFAELSAAHGYVAVATAHHADDNVETLLINLMRGCGMQGLKGIPPRNGKIIRPLLFASRSEIDAFVTENKIPFREDESNATDAYLRNALRLQILPALNNLMPAATQNMAESINRFREAEKLFTEGLKKELKGLVETRQNDTYISIKKLQKSDVKSTLLFHVLAPFGFSAAQAKEAEKLSEAETSKKMLSQTHSIFKHGDFLIVTEHKSEQAAIYQLDDHEGTIDTADGIFIFRKRDALPKVMNDDSNRIFVDVAKISLPLIVRKRSAGDYFYPLGMNRKKKKLGKFLSDHKVPMHMRDSIWVVASGEKIIWIAGYRIDERFQIDKAAPGAVLEINFKPQKARKN